mmetsp:Transcript_8131/g.15901  ORF Transcript_8131/g.15901 Transcript_8131/m.15901 type:complete len:298 (+) Transcript_8131:10-903(+)
MSEMSLSLTGLKFFAVASAIGMILSPVYEVQAFRKEGTGERHPLPYAMIALNSGLWCFYAILKNDWFPMMATNSIGAFAGYIYLSVFSYYSDPEKCRYDARKYALGVLFSEMMVAMALFMTTDQMSSDEQCDYLGMLATSILVMTFASPLIVIVQVCRTRNSSALSRPLSVLGFLCACAWTTYGKLIDDVYVWGPNGLGIMLTAMQLLVIVMYPKRSPGPSDGVSKLPQNGSKRNSRSRKEEMSGSKKKLENGGSSVSVEMAPLIHRAGSGMNTNKANITDDERARAQDLEDVDKTA